ncbi:MAG TPA: alcohol dehydrogenase catalytic domain-containing protein [candidate division Zixibacteria bacterium]|nr:alcohol dehydrogenase catalytic domain-containing protein [candidate division Zixibacteria bacterium]
MKALHWDGRALSLVSSAMPRKEPGAALVRVRLAGICDTDLQIFKGYMGFRGIPGHEVVGVVAEGPAPLMDRRVVAEINFACGSCTECRRGLGNHCASRKVMGIAGADGAFAEYVAVPPENLHLVPDGVPDEAAVCTEPLAAAFEILEQVQVNPADRVLILGDGKLGFLCAQVLKLTGAAVTVVGKHAGKLERIRQRSIRTEFLDGWKPSAHDVVVEATGSADGLRRAIEAVRPRGTLVLKSTVAEAHSVSLAPLVVNEVTVIGSRCGPFAPALEALAERKVAVEPLIERIYPLDAGLEAVAHAARPGARKILLRP